MSDRGHLREDRRRHRSGDPTAGGDTVTEEFALPAEATLDRTDMTEVMRYDSERVYRFRREAG